MLKSLARYAAPFDDVGCVMQYYHSLSNRKRVDVHNKIQSWVPGIQVSDDGTPSVGAVKVFDFGVNFDLDTYVKAVQMAKQQKFKALFGNEPQAVVPVAAEAVAQDYQMA